MDHTNMTNTGPYHGGMVAFEGPADIVSTQLRLLPPSSQVLILPDLEDYMKRDDARDFSVRSYLKDVHEAAQARHEVASKFLSDSSRGHKRLVFLNGGTAAALSQCIAAISHYQTAGDSLHAEMILRDVLRDGVQGLDQQDKDCHQLAMRRADSVGTRDGCPWEDEEPEEDPITRAMKAADALYKETEALEPIECYIRTRPRSLSFPVPAWADGLGQASPCFIFGPPPNEDVQPVSTAEDADHTPRRFTVRSSTQCSEMTIPVAYRSSTAMEPSPMVNRSVAGRSHIRNQSSTSNALLSPPMSPSEVEFGEARLVQMQASRKAGQSLRRTRSLDDMELHRTRMRRRVVSSPSPAPELPTPPMEDQEIKSPCRHLSILEDPFSNNNLIRLPRAKFVRANTTTIRKSPTFAKPPYNSMASNPCANRDAKSETEHANEEGSIDAARDPVLPFHEDLVIQFTGEISNHILDSVIESLQGGLYPVSTAAVDYDGTAETESCPSTPRTADLFDVDDFDEGLSPVIEITSVDDCVDYDAQSTSGLSRVSNFRFHSPCPSLPPEVQPPTPAHTPPILGTDADGRRSRFQIVSTIDRVNAIAIQNNLRLILDAQFPPDQDRRYRMSRISLLPQMDKIWRPIFWNVGSKGRNPSERTADLILAIGAQNSVKAEFVSALTGQVEKLGSKSTGMTRSGRLDLRFLVANAMQSFTTQSLASQLQENLFDSPHLLACLIVPHLATYLSVNTSIRFLVLEYPAEHLATVVAMQNLVGVDILKIAGVIDSEAASAYNTEPSSPIGSLQSPRLSSGSSSSTAAAAAQQLARSLDAISLPGSPFALPPFPPQSPFGAGPPTLAQRRRLSFSKANYVLTNTATEAEIASFISIVWRILVQADPFYAPEHGGTNQLPIMGAISTRPTTAGSRYPTSKASNGSLVSSKFAAASSTAPSTPLSTTTAPPSVTNLHHPCYPHWGQAGSLQGASSPPGSQGSSNTSIPRSLVDLHDYPSAPPPGPVPPPPPPSSLRGESPSGASFRSARSRGRAGPGRLAGSLHSNEHTSASPVDGGGNVAAANNDNSNNTLAAPTAHVFGAGAGVGGFSLRPSKSLNRILASRRGRKASAPGPITTTASPTPSTSASGGAAPFRPTKTPTTPTPAPVAGSNGVLHGGPPPFLSISRSSSTTTSSGGRRRGGNNNNGGGSDDAAAVGSSKIIITTAPTPAPAAAADQEGLEYLDDEERRLMPMYNMRQQDMMMVRRGNSRKAMKWLGLA